MGADTTYDESYFKKTFNFEIKQPIVELYKAVQSEGSRLRPTIVVRTTGCTHRCWFGEEGGWCDSWYTSIHPEKGRYSLSDIIKLYDENPQIKDMMITGGSPTMHPKLLEALTQIAKERGIFTTLETEGSHFVQTEHKIDLVSISPKFQNSIPLLGIKTPKGGIVDGKFIKQHNKFRLFYDSIRKMIDYHSSYQIKPVWGGELDVLSEIESLQQFLDIPNDKIYLMPAGGTRAQLLKTYPIVMEKCIEKGWSFTGRPHIIAYDEKREV